MNLLQDPASPPPPSTIAEEEPRLRARARRRAWFCPGAGWALLGHGRRAMTTFLLYFAFLAALGWLIVSWLPAALWLTIAALVVTLIAWLGEISAVKRATIRPGQPGWLARRFWPATALTWAASLAIPALMALEFGRTDITGAGMAPALDAGERVLFRRRIDPADLHAGAVVLFRLPPQARIGEPGMLLVGRLLAVPGDTLSIRNDHYVVNGETTDYLADKKIAIPAVDVPRWPETLKVREGRYFVVQDSPRPGIDSRLLSWIHDRDLVSARLIHVSRRQLFQPVE